MTSATIPGLLADLLAADPARPLVTFYDDATGERIELSVKSFENWVAKTANLLQTELSAEPGAHVQVRLPTHWQAAVWLFAAAACGARVSLGPGVHADVEVLVCGPEAESVRPAPATGTEVVMLSLRPMGLPFEEPLPAGTTDYAGSVLAQGDVFAPLAAVDADAPFVLSPDGALSQREVLARARDGAQARGLAPAGRLLTDANPATLAGLTGGLLAAVVAGGSVVLTRNTDPAAVDARVSQEQVSAQWWGAR